MLSNQDYLKLIDWVGSKRDVRISPKAFCSMLSFQMLIRERLSKLGYAIFQTRYAVNLWDVKKNITEHKIMVELNNDLLFVDSINRLVVETLKYKNIRSNNE